MKIGIFLGSTTGNTEAAANALKAELDKAEGSSCEILNVKTADLDAIKGFDLTIIGCPTWNVGELQEDWAAQFPGLQGMDFSGRKLAFFGCGDQVGYLNNFQDALGILGNVAVAKGAEVYGFWSTEGYDFVQSEGVIDQHFLGLALDDDNQPDQTQARIEAWSRQLRAELGI
ncbi:MAG: flavodoxin [Caldilineae bacterium]|nr:flavodoxin [Chloroflexota bacterium]MCB9175711.1 flavodoxin [Caldilineae bacterium]